ncbi:MAG: tyrosine--tRNA ligase [Sphingobacteriia bacterium]|nr:tyrosine--tRNA ligase [Sphingobacteriia bacterium]
MNNFIEELRWRGKLQDVMPGTEALLQQEQVTAYIGFDPTADSLHVGSLVQIILMMRLQKAGHKPIALIGGATGMIGDPSGKSEERNLLNADQLQQNVEGVQKQLSQFLDFTPGPNAAVLLNNYDWYKQMGLLDFMREVGKHLTVNYMMAKDSVSRRMEAGGLSFTEFSYQLIQGYDFYYLYKNHGCKLQMGGSDQWGNITAGTELIRRIGGGEGFALTIPLITKSDGTKFGKSEGGNIWLDPTKTSPYQFYQFWLNISDEEASQYIYLFSFSSQEEILALLDQQKNKPEARELQQALAQEMTLLVHGINALESAKAATDFLFGKGGIQNRSLKEPWFDEVRKTVPGAQVERALFSSGVSVAQLLTDIQVFPSKAELKRMVQGGGLKINEQKIENPDQILTLQDLIEDEFLLIQKGKKNYFVVEVINSK